MRICDHDECMTLVVGPSGSGTTLLTACLSRAGLKLHPSVEPMNGSLPRHGLEGSIVETAKRYGIQSIDDWMHNHPTNVLSAEMMVGELERWHAEASERGQHTLAKVPALSCWLYELLGHVTVIKHVFVCVRDLVELSEKSAGEYGWYNDMYAARHDIMAHVGGAVMACMHQALRRRDFGWGIICYPEYYELAGMIPFGGALLGAGFSREFASAVMERALELFDPREDG